MIAFLINDIDVKGGTHKQLLKLLDYYTEKGVDFKVITRVVDFDLTYNGFANYKNKIFEINRIKSSSVVTRAINYLLSFWSLRKLLSEVDIVNIHDGGYEFLLPAFVGKKVYWQINDIHPCFGEGVMNNSNVSFSNKLRARYIRFFSFLVKEFTVNVSKNKELVKKYFNQDAHVFYCGIENMNIQRDSIGTVERFNNKKINLLSSGVFLPYRNYETVVSVVEELKLNNIDVSLSIIGSTALNPKYTDKIKNLITTKGLDDSIRICGRIDDSEFVDLHRNADVFVFINVNQSWGLAVFEAMSCGIPVIVSESVGATEILEDDVNAIFVDPFNVNQIVEKITGLMNDNNKYALLSKTSVEFCDNYTWEKSYCSKMYELITL